MDNKFLTPLQLWKDFNPVKEGLDISYQGIDKHETYVCKHLYYTAESIEDEKIRVYAKIISPINNRKKPIILMVGDIDNPINDEAMLAVAEAGYIAIACDYSNSKKYNYETKYPESLDYANLDCCKDNLYCPQNSIKNCCWYTWAKVIRRLISVAIAEPKADEDNIGIIGIKAGSYMAWQIASMDTRIKAMSSIVGSELGNTNEEKTSNYTAEEINFQAGVAAKSYAKFMTTPILMVASSNCDTSNIDNIKNLFTYLPEETQTAISIMPRCNHNITKNGFNTAKKWFSYHFRNSNFPNQPKLSYDMRANQLNLQVVADEETKPIKHIKLYYSYNEENPSYRNWYVERLESDLNYSTILNINNSNKHYIFANIVYNDNTTLSTDILEINPEELDIEIKSKPQTYIIYDANNGIESFTSESEVETFLDDNDPYIEKSELEMISGLTTDYENLSTYFIGDDNCIKKTDSILQIDINSPENTTLEVIITTLEDNQYKEYSSDWELESSIDWKRLSFECTDFKSDKMIPLKAWENAKKLSIKFSNKILISNILFV